MLFGSRKLNAEFILIGLYCDVLSTPSIYHPDSLRLSTLSSLRRKEGEKVVFPSLLLQ